MNIIAGFSALLHVYIFVMESLVWGSARANKGFGVTPEHAEIMRPFAFNQGFYNLFLAIAIALGLFLQSSPDTARGQILVDYGMASIFGAGVVLIGSNPRLWVPGLAQALPPFIYGALRLLQN